MDDRDIRLECLRLANVLGGHDQAIIERARAYADFVIGTNDGEVIAAARELADKVRAP